MNPSSVPRPEFPRPDRERSEWQSLNGPWEFAFSPRRATASHLPDSFDSSILVPFVYQSPASGINKAGEHHDVMWYRRQFDVPNAYLVPGRRLVLHFGAVDWEADVWVNGHFIGRHEGGYTPFWFDITAVAQLRGNSVVVQAVDLQDTTQPRGKQNWGLENWGCWYSDSSGIWQSVWLESVGGTFLEEVRFTPDLLHRQVSADLLLNGPCEGLTLETVITFEGHAVVSTCHSVDSRRTRMLFDIRETNEVDEVHFWTPDNPRLYEVQFRLLGPAKGAVLDIVRSSFGMRSMTVVNGQVLLNNRPLYQRLVLDQGYWTETLLTPPSDAALIEDLKRTKELGFNGVRMHQKIEDPRFYYHADRLGLLVWGEMPSAYRFDPDEVANVTREWQAAVRRDYNHPCIVTWVPLNESWGVRNIFHDPQQQAFARALVHLTKALDPLRLVSANDGWEHVGGDILAIHDYEALGETFARKTADLERTLNGSFSGRMALASGTKYNGEPLLITEFGGIAFAGDGSTWGYAGAVNSEAEFLERLSSIVAAIRADTRIQGFCYTQLCDVFQEANGLMTMARQAKVDPAALKAVFGSRP